MTYIHKSYISNCASVHPPPNTIAPTSAAAQAPPRTEGVRASIPPSTPAPNFVENYPSNSASQLPPASNFFCSPSPAAAQAKATGNGATGYQLQYPQQPPASEFQSSQNLQTTGYHHAQQLHQSANLQHPPQPHQAANQVTTQATKRQIHS